MASAMPDGQAGVRRGDRARQLMRRAKQAAVNWEALTPPEIECAVLEEIAALRPNFERFQTVPIEN